MGGEMVANIRIEPDKVINAGKKVKSVAGQYKTQINTIYRITDELKQYWQGSAAGRFVTDIESYRKQFEDFGVKIEEHGDLLTDVGTDYDRLENGGI